jgi:hypothetical protein
MLPFSWGDSRQHSPTPHFTIMQKEIERLLELWDLPITPEYRNEAIKLCREVGQDFIEKSRETRIHPDIEEVRGKVTPKVLTVMFLSMMNMTMMD